MNKLDELIAYHANELDNLRLLKSILDSGDCNTCIAKKTCGYVPRCGEQVRFNCPHYERDDIKFVRRSKK
jgi:hypothetical protein